MQMLNAQLTDDDLRSLRALRITRVRGAPTPPVPVKIAGRLGGLGLMRPQDLSLQMKTPAKSMVKFLKRHFLR